MTLSNLNTNWVAGSYLNDLYAWLKEHENTVQPNGTLFRPGIHGPVTNGVARPTIGFGFDLVAHDYNEIEDAIGYAFNGALTTLQQEGLQIIEAWKNHTAITINGQQVVLTNANLVSIAEGTFGEQQQQQALQSLEMTDTEATRLLDVVILGYVGFPGYESTLLFSPMTGAS